MDFDKTRSVNTHGLGRENNCKRENNLSCVDASEKKKEESRKNRLKKEDISMLRRFRARVTSTWLPASKRKKKSKQALRLTRRARSNAELLQLTGPAQSRI
jgi:hypothetical protein